MPTKRKIERVSPTKKTIATYYLQHAARLLVDQTGDALHAAASCQTPDGRLGDALDVVAQHLAMALGASLAQSLSSLTATGHFFLLMVGVWGFGSTKNKEYYAFGCNV